MSNELIEALSALLGRPITRQELSKLGVFGSERTITRRGQDLHGLSFHEIRGLAEELDVPVVEFLIATKLVTDTEVARAADSIDQLLNEATPLELARRLVCVLEGR